jgi:hypothetical protein
MISFLPDERKRLGLGILQDIFPATIGVITLLSAVTLWSSLFMSARRQLREGN